MRENKIVLVSDDGCNHWRSAMRHTYTGDFRKKDSGFKKLPREDKKNNLYKGAAQLMRHFANLKNTVGAIVSKYPFTEASLKIMPLIVTNASIFIKENNHTAGQLTPVNWAAYSTSTVKIDENNFIDHVFIVNVDHLSKFIRIFG